MPRGKSSITVPTRSIHPSDRPAVQASERARLSSLDAIARNKLRRLGYDGGGGGRRDGQAGDFLVVARDAGGRVSWCDRLHGSMPRIEPSFILRSRREGVIYAASAKRPGEGARVMQLPRDAPIVMQRSSRGDARSMSRWRSSACEDRGGRREREREDVFLYSKSVVFAHSSAKRVARAPAVAPISIGVADFASWHWVVVDDCVYF